MNIKSKNAGSLPVRLFAGQRAWLAWLGKNHKRSAGIWLRFAKKGSGLKSLSREEALDGALCYGWIDGQGKSDGASYWIQKYTPRSPRSLWSKRNREKALALVKSGQMKPAGRAAIARARKDGRWHAAYDSPKSMSVPRDFQAALRRNARAKAFFETLDGRNRYAMLYRLQTVKTAATRAAHIERFVAMLTKRETLYPTMTGGKRSR